MKSFRSPRGCIKALGIIVFASLLCAISAPLMAQAPSPTELEGESWRRTILETPRPKSGCFTATYPETEWREVLCKTPPHNLFLPKRGGAIRTQTLGGTGPDYSAVVTGFITEAEGSFASVTGVTSECAVQCPNQICPTNPTCTSAPANQYSLQLNSKPFTTETCSGSPNQAECQGWEQFVYLYSGDGYIQYWLLNYGPAGTACPPPRGASCALGGVWSDGWCPFSFTTGGEVYCVVNSMKSAPAPSEPITSLGQLILTGAVAGVAGATNDSITVTVGGTPYTASGNSYFPDLGSRWQEVEFNVFGDGGGDQAVFNSGSTIIVTTSVASGTASGPTADEQSFTGESNNLTLVPTYCPYGGASPKIEFMESNAASPAATCFSSGLQAFTTLASFNGTDGANPYTGLVQATNGDLYGTTVSGGANGDGTVFKVTTSSALTTLYSFCSQSGCTDGANPYAGLVHPTSGYLYGTTFSGGANGDGTVFKITPSGTLTTLYSFCAQSSCTDGASPDALVQAANGYLYGTTSYGGAADGGGTVFRITPSGALTTLYSFCSQANCADGEEPAAGLVQATNGNLYGTTFYGGANGDGTVFKITPTGALTTLYSFCSLSACTDGKYTYAGLVQATNGDLYGTTYSGGAGTGGTVFKITPSGTLTTLYSFCAQSTCTDGALPTAALIQATNGNLYGTTGYGGGAGGGTVFSLYVGLGPFVETLPTSGKVGAAVKILGTNLTGATGVTFNSAATVFTVVSPSLITTTVPAGATTGKVQVVTPGGTLSSNVPFRVP